MRSTVRRPLSQRWRLGDLDVHAGGSVAEIGDPQEDEPALLAADVESCVTVGVLELGRRVAPLGQGRLLGVGDIDLGGPAGGGGDDLQALDRLALVRLDHHADALAATEVAGRSSPSARSWPGRRRSGRPAARPSPRADRFPRGRRWPPRRSTGVAVVSSASSTVSPAGVPPSTTASTASATATTPSATAGTIQRRLIGAANGDQRRRGQMAGPAVRFGRRGAPPASADSPAAWSRDPTPRSASRRAASAGGDVVEARPHRLRRLPTLGRIAGQAPQDHRLQRAGDVGRI